MDKWQMGYSCSVDSKIGVISIKEGICCIGEKWTIFYILVDL